jgi:hypothetical protein
MAESVVILPLSRFIIGLGFATLSAKHIGQPGLVVRFLGNIASFTPTNAKR